MCSRCICLGYDDDSMNAWNDTTGVNDWLNVLVHSYKCPEPSSNANDSQLLKPLQNWFPRHSEGRADCDVYVEACHLPSRGNG